MRATDRLPLALAGLALALLVAGCATNVNLQGHRLNPGGQRDREREEFARADPSRVVAAELAFARLAQEKGQWTAFAETATDEAVMFVPQPVNARRWLRGRANPPQAVRWQPHQVWSSCDGTLAATRGAWQQPDGSVGYFTTVWERQRRGEYKWVMDQGDTLSEPLAAPEMVAGKVADCRSGAVPPPPVTRAPLPEDPGGQSRDGTLVWRVFVERDGSRSVEVRYWDGTTWQFAIQERVAGR